jgi:hypothetical protein
MKFIVRLAPQPDAPDTEEFKSRYQELENYLVENSSKMEGGYYHVGHLSPFRQQEMYNDCGRIIGEYAPHVQMEMMYVQEK